MENSERCAMVIVTHFRRSDPPPATAQIPLRQAQGRLSRRISWPSAGVAAAQHDKFGKADLHIHTAHSDGMAEAAELLDYVEAETDLDVIAITDHDDIRGAWATREVWARGRYRFDLVLGVEVTTIEGHLLALYVEDPIPALCPIEQVIDAVHRQGGLCVIPHPMSPLTRSLDRKTIDRVVAGERDRLHFDGIEAAHRSPILGRWRRTGAVLNRALGLAEMSNSDAHFLNVIGSAFTGFPGRTSAELKESILSKNTRAVTGHCPTLAEIGLGQALRQSWRGLNATPRAMGWGPTAVSFVRRIFHLQ